MQIRPYVVIPKLIAQPTWGGDYIGKMKLWDRVIGVSGVKIGQSYELFGGSKLAIKVTDTVDPDFIPELGQSDATDPAVFFGNRQDGIDFISLSELVKTNPKHVLGEKVYKTYGVMPLLIKLNQASGNSFQVHLPPNKTHPRWKPKAESWYYLEDGRLTFGIKKGIDVEEYKRVCYEIDAFMKDLSQKVEAQELSLEAARSKASQFVKTANPWAFVNVHEAKKNSIIDLSRGGIHHSWEENSDPTSPGNVIYEVQQDVMDPRGRGTHADHEAQKEIR